MMRIFLSGYGRMGRLIEELALEKGWEVVGHADITCPEVYETAPAADCCIDFSGVNALPGLLSYLRRTKTPLVSGTTGFSKGVVLPYRALWSNFDFLNGMMGKHIPRGSNCVCILPMAHMYGLMDDVLFQFCLGSHIFFLTRMPTPTLVAEALAEIRPRLICSVPLVVEKIVRKKIFPEFQTSMVRLLMNMPLLRDKVKERICERVREVFGGNLYQVMVGGASLSREVEEFFVSIGFPITVGYGTTETAPMITMSNWDDFVPGSCGTPATHMRALKN